VKDSPLGVLFRVSLFGESHGCCVGVMVEGVPPGLKVSEDYINSELARRRPGKRFTTARRETDKVEVLSGVYMGYTTGAPITMIIRNIDVDSSFYEEVVRFMPRPGHADLPSRLRSMGFEDYRGGGPFSGRLTAGLVAAGAIAKKILEEYGISVFAYVKKLGSVNCHLEEPLPMSSRELKRLVDERDSSPFYCPDKNATERMTQEVAAKLREGGSIGGQVEVLAFNVPPGLGEPLGDSLDGDIAKALFSIPGVKAVEFGSGIKLAEMTGKEARDSIVVKEGRLRVEPGHGGGVLGGLSTGSTIRVTATLKPTSSIPIPQQTIDWRGIEPVELRSWGRHDPTIVIRATPAAEAAVAIILADHLLRWMPYRIAHYYRLEAGANESS